MYTIIIIIITTVNFLFTEHKLKLDMNFVSPIFILDIKKICKKNLAHLYHATKADNVSIEELFNDIFRR